MTRKTAAYLVAKVIVLVMKMLFILLFVSLSLSVTSAQTITVSEDIPLRNDIAYELIGKLGEHTLLFRDRTVSFEVQAFDSRMKESWSKELELDKRNPSVLGVFANPTEDNFALVYSFRQRGRTMLKVHKYDPAANLQDSATIVDLGFLFFTPGFEVVQSDDHSKLLVYYTEQQNIVRSYAFDMETMHLLWEKSFAPEDFFFGQHFIQALIDNSGRMYYVLERDNFRTRRKPHYFEVFTFGVGDSEVRTSQVEMEDKLTYDVFFNYDNLNNYLVGAGLFADKDINRAQGHFYLRLQPLTGEAPLLRFNNFDEEFMAGLLGKENIKENRGINETSVRESILRRDGGVLLVGERNRQLERRTGSTSRVFYDGTTRMMVDYYYDELFIIAINPDGRPHWHTILHKKQYSQDDDGAYSSYFLFKTPSRLRFLFNDEIRYENTVSEYVLNGVGQYDRNSLFSTANLELRLRFRNALQVDSDEIIVPSERRNRLKLVKLEY